MHKIARLLRPVLLGWIILPIASVQAADWYLAPSGNDTNNCTVKETPCFSIQGVVEKAAFAAGDLLLLQTGSYDLKDKIAGWGDIATKTFEVYGGYNADYTARSSDPSKTTLTSSATSNNGRLLAFKTGHLQPIVFDGVRFGEFIQVGRPDHGIITTHAEGAWIKLNNVIFEQNKLEGAAAIRLAVANDRLEVNKAAFNDNDATVSVAGAIRLDAGTRAIIRDTIFYNNSSVSSGGALYVNNAAVDLTNVTFYANAAAQGGAIYATGNKAKLNCMHCTVAANTATHVATNKSSFVLVSNASLSVKNSVLVNEGGDIVNLSGGAQFLDFGYNAFGLNDAVAATGIVLPAHANSYKNIEANTSDLFELDVDYNGGTLKSLKPFSINSSLIDKIPNDVPALLTGDTPLAPFTSLSAAHNALTARDHYKRKTYFFEIGNKKFSTIVDKEGWVLIASGNRLSISGAYAETANLIEKADEVLNRTILAEPGFAFDEVRITSRDNKPVAIDVRSSEQKVIDAVKAFTMLPNNHTAAGPYGNGAWYAVMGSERINSNVPVADNLTCLPNNGVVKNLNEVIYDACGKAHGIKWAPAGEYGHVEAHEWPSSPQLRTTDFNLWVRSSDIHCGGIVKTDQRGMPRPDYANTNDPNQYGDVRDCDIGAFEWNNGYQLDCYDEDGERPENTITNSEVNFCIKHPSQLTPKGIIDNLGSFSWAYIAMLLMLVIGRSTFYKTEKSIQV